MKVKRESEVAQSCPTMCDPIDCCPPGSAIPGVLQARILDWVAISFSNRFNAIPIKLPMAFFTELEKKNFKIHMGTPKNPNSQSSLEKEEMKLEDSTLLTSDYTTKLWSSRQKNRRHKNKNIDQRNKIESPEINLCNYGDKGGENIQWDKDSLFNKRC